MDNSTSVCVDVQWAINMGLHWVSMRSSYFLDQLIKTIWKDCLSLMVPQDSISGHLLLLREKVQLPMLCALAVAIIALGHTPRHSLEMTISVTLALRISHKISFTLPTLCGKVLDVVPPAPVVSSTTLPGSARLSPSPPLMTWRSGLAKNLVVLVMHLFSLLKYIYSRTNVKLLEESDDFQVLV